MLVGNVLPRNKILGQITPKAWQGQLKCEVYRFDKTNAYNGSGKSWFHKYRKNWQICHTSAAIEILLPLQKWNHRAAPQGAHFAWLGDKTSPGQTAVGRQRSVRGESLLSVRSAVLVLDSPIPWCSWLWANCQLAAGMIMRVRPSENGTQDEQQTTAVISWRHSKPPKRSL